MILEYSPQHVPKIPSVNEQIINELSKSKIHHCKLVACKLQVPPLDCTEKWRFNQPRYSQLPNQANS